MADTELQERPKVRAVAKYIGTSPYKVRQVVNLIRNKDVEAAQVELLLCDRGPAHEVSKLLNSAIANAEHNNQIPAEELKVSEAFVDEGPTLKRFRARARGRGTRIFKRTCHITIIVERMSEEEIEKKSQKEANSGAANAREQRRRRAEASKAAQKAKEEASASTDEEISEDEEVIQDKPKAKKAPAKKKADSDVEDSSEVEKKPASKKSTSKKTTAKKAGEAAVDSDEGTSAAIEETSGSESPEGREAVTESEDTEAAPKAKKTTKKTEEKEGDA